jgi:hypothetical protein
MAIEPLATLALVVYHRPRSHDPKIENVDSLAARQRTPIRRAELVEKPCGAEMIPCTVIILF